jgi:hypothetical protein
MGMVLVKDIPQHNSPSLAAFIYLFFFNEFVTE